MGIDPTESRFISIESKLRLLIVLSIAQSIVIALLVAGLFIKQFMPTTLTLILILATLAVFLYAFRSQIPAWFGSTSRFVFSYLFEAQKPDSVKDKT